MPPAAKKEAIVLILDVRKNTSQQSDTDTTINEVRECAKKIVLKKIVADSKDHISLIVLGSKDTNNIINENITYENISVIRQLQMPTWEMVEDILIATESSTDCGGDILESFVVAHDILVRADPSGYSALKIVLISIANGGSNLKSNELMLKELKRLGVQVTVIGPDVAQYSQSRDTEEASIEMRDLPAEQRVVVGYALETDGLVCRFQDALSQLTKFERKKTKPRPWNVTLNIGLHIKLPVSGVIRTTTADQIKTKTQRVDETKAPVAKDYIFTATTSTSAIEVPVERADVVDGYNFGSTIVPFSADEQADLSYKSGPKSLSVLFFTKSSNVPRYLYVGTGTYHFFPAKDPRVKKAFIALVHAMKKENVVAIARRIYNNNNNPTIAILAPKIKKKYTCLEYVALPYADDVRIFSFPPLVTKKSQPSAEQLDAVDELITSMDLMEVTEDDDCGEAFRSKDTVDPIQQHMCEVICEKALNPSKEVGKPSDTVRKMLVPPAEVEKRSFPILEKIADVFPLLEKKPKEGTRKAAADVFKNESVDPLKLEVNSGFSTEKKVPRPLDEIGTLTPIEDFNRMLEEKLVPFGKVCSQMQGVIWKFVESAFDIEDLKKTLLSVRALRNACVKEDPMTYNSWISRIIDELPPAKKTFWKLLVEDGLTLITSDESPLSTISREQAEDLLREEPAPPEDDDDDNDSLNDLVNDM